MDKRVTGTFNHGLLRTSRCIFNTTGGNVTAVTTVYYKDIKEERMDTVHDLLQALFETERRLLIEFRQWFSTKPYKLP